MGILCDYFRAPDRAAALALHQHEDGLFEAAARTGTEAIDLKGIDPVVILGKLVGLLSGAPFEEMLLSGIPTDHIPGPELLTSEEDERILVELSAFVRDTLAAATEPALAEAAPLWAGIEEFSHSTWFEPDEMRPVIDDLAGLARRARDAGQMMYCAVCV
jgi:hypothetical protein